MAGAGTEHDAGYRTDSACDRSGETRDAQANDQAAGTADVLASISDSNENKVGLIGVIGNGFEYTPYGQG